MTRPWTVIDRVDTAEGPLELRRRGPSDYMITIAGRSLMISAGNRSELAVAQLACERHGNPRRVLVGGLGMGFTLRAALDSVGPDAEVTVVEITEQVVTWCRGEMAALTGDACADPRTRVVVGDVAEVIAGSAPGRWDAIILDLYEGPHAATQGADDPFYGPAALAATARALARGGVFAVWSEEREQRFEADLRRAGFAFDHVKSGRGRRHSVYLATR